LKGLVVRAMVGNMVSNWRLMTLFSLLSISFAAHG
jgi:hypothetical protein